jgi:hypothetical protein
MVLEHTHGLFITKTELRLSTTFIPVIIIMYMITTVIQTFNHSFAHTIQLHIYMAQFPLFFSPLAGSLLLPLCVPFYLLGTLQL